MPDEPDDTAMAEPGSPLMRLVPDWRHLRCVDVTALHADLDLVVDQTQ